MAMDMLRQLAASPLPATFRTSEEIDQIKLLRAAGLVIALTPAPLSSLRTLSGTTDTAQCSPLPKRGARSWPGSPCRETFPRSRALLRPGGRPN